MQKLFVLLRQGNIDEVKRLISKKPELRHGLTGVISGALSGAEH